MARADPSPAGRRALIPRAILGAGASLLLLRCIGPITPTACETDAQCTPATTCQNRICVYRQGYGEGGAGGADAGATDAGATDAARD
jgi:hypothetical protein